MSDQDRTRRDAMKLLVGSASLAGIACENSRTKTDPRKFVTDDVKSASSNTHSKETEEMSMTNVILETGSLPPGTTPWPTLDPFLFCVHHRDHFPRGNAAFGPQSDLRGRAMGRDFSGKDGWSMYHGEQVPGFPRHPHRGFETITIVRKGLLDHSDSMGASARYGEGDVQWLTAGSGILHSEMFPLLRAEADNPVELFQIWINLPSSSKMVDPNFRMFWADQMPMITTDAGVEIQVSAGRWGDAKAPDAPPDSWAFDPEHEIGIWSIRLPPHAQIDLPIAKTAERMLYVHDGGGLQIHGQAIAPRSYAKLDGTKATKLQAGERASEVLILQARPIKEPVAQHGPFVMNTTQEIRQAYLDFQSTQFGGWPWDRSDPVHGEKPERFARHADGRIDRPTT